MFVTCPLQAYHPSIMTKSLNTPVDFLVRIALVRREPTSSEASTELSPSVWRRFKVSAHIDLGLLHDKVLVPLMGWTRNFIYAVFDDDHQIRALPPPKK